MVAVSGGIDSVVLLHLLVTTFHLPHSTFHIVVAHFDHGIRDDSVEDRQFVEGLAKQGGLQFYYREGNLGRKTSEAEARSARYQFLQEIREKTNAETIITAHHEDDLIESAFINVLRGTGRKGLSSLGSGREIKRPLLGKTKQEIKDYAAKHNLAWHEDSTNLDNRYLRNYLRNRVLPKLTAAQRIQLVDILDSAGQRNIEIDKILARLVYIDKSGKMDRSWFIALPHAVAREVLSHWLNECSLRFDRVAIERLVVSLKTLHPGAKSDITGGWYFIIGKKDIRIQRL